MPVIYVLNGPELNLLGEREPAIYGDKTLAQVEELCRERATSLGFDIDFRQTDDESQMVEWISEASHRASGIVINPAIFTHHSLKVREALRNCGVGVVEVHISNINAREPWRAHSMVSGVVRGSIIGLGVSGYPLAIEAIAGSG